MTRRTLALLLPAILAAPALAATSTVYRCGQGYQQVPCAGSQPVDMADPRSSDQRHAARAAASAERRQAETLAAERHEREKAPGQRQPMGLGVQPPQAAASASVSSAPKHPKKKRGRTQPVDELPRYVAPPTKS